MKLLCRNDCGNTSFRRRRTFLVVMKLRLETDEVAERLPECLFERCTDMDKLGTLFFVPGEKPMPPMTERVIARGPVKSRGPQAINREIDAFRAAIDRSGSKVEEAFIAVLAPGWLDHFIFNEYYNTDEEFLFAPG
jgi:hypothetical protein